MKTVVRNVILFLLLPWSFRAYAQPSVAEYVNPRKAALLSEKEDTIKVKLLTNISVAYSFSYPDTARIYAQRAIDLAEKVHFEKGLLNANRSLIRSFILSGNFPLALDYGFKAHALAKRIGKPLDIIFATGNLAQCYFYLGDYNTCLKYDRDVVKIVKEFYPDSIGFICCDISKAFEALNQSDSALYYGKKCYTMLTQWNMAKTSVYVYNILGNAFASNGEYDSAIFYYRIGLPLSMTRSFSIFQTDICNGLARAHEAKGNLDSALWYSRMALNNDRKALYPNGVLKAANMLSDIYELRGNADSSLKYLRMAIHVKDSVFNRDQTVAVQNLAFKELEKEKALAASEQELRSRFRMYLFVACAIALLVIAGIFLHYRRQKQLLNMRNSIADDLHDDIGSTLSSISIMSELAKARPPETSALLSSIGESTVSIQENMSDIVWAIKSENDSFRNVLLRMNEFATEILEARNITLDFASDETLAASRLSMKQRKNMYLFFKEAINNAAKHSKAEKVTVTISRRAHSLELLIRDDGIGFDKNQVVHGNGMASLKKRADDLNGSVNIYSRPGESTTVQLIFRMK